MESHPEKKSSLFSRLKTKIQEITKNNNKRNNDLEVLENQSQKDEETDNAEQINKHVVFEEKYSIGENYIPVIEKGTIEEAINQYLLGVVYKGKNQGVYDSYLALMNLSAIPNDGIGNNLQNEEKLVQYLEKREKSDKNSKFNLKKQYSNSNKEDIAFYCVKKNLSKMNWNSKRIYLNCKKANVAELATCLISNFEDLDSYYFKFASNDINKNKNHSEQIVIYIDNYKQFQKIVSKIEKTKEQRPELFEGSENINPFMKSYKGYIAYTNGLNADKIATKDENGNYKEEKWSVYLDMKGNFKAIKSSYNSILACALEESMIHGIDDLLKENYRFRDKLKLEENEKDNPSVYALKVLPQIVENEKFKIELIKNMKQNLKEIQNRNPILNIKGIDKSNGKDMDKTL